MTQDAPDGSYGDLPMPGHDGRSHAFFAAPDELDVVASPNLDANSFGSLEHFVGPARLTL
jgi:hypothetical protein